MTSKRQRVPGLVRQQRRRLTRAVAQRLTEEESPRFAMFVILSAAGLSGFLASYGLLQAGMQSMGLRYPLAVLVGYGAFLVGIRVWLAVRRTDLQLDLPDPVDAGVSAGGDWAPVEPTISFGGGGGFSGGGAGGSIDPVGGSGSLPELSTAPDIGGIEAAADLDELGVVVLAIVAVAFVIAGLVGTISVIVAAPSLLAEVLVDAVIAGTAYRHLRHLTKGHWLKGTVRRTWKSVVALVVTLSVVGILLQSLGAGIDSIGDVFDR